MDFGKPIRAGAYAPAFLFRMLLLRARKNDAGEF